MFRFAQMTARTTRAPQTDVKIETLEDAVIGQSGPNVPGSDLMQEAPEEEELQSRPSPEDSFLLQTGDAGPDIGGRLFDEGEEATPQRIGFVAGGDPNPDRFRRHGERRDCKAVRRGRRGRMMVLLDTHLLLWAAGEPHKLSPAARAHILDPAVSGVRNGVSGLERRPSSLIQTVARVSFVYRKFAQNKPTKSKVPTW
jgi:hypothetical protein